MNKIVFTFIISLFFSCSSKKNESCKLEKNDSLKVNHLKKIINKEIYYNPDSTLLLCKKLKDICNTHESTLEFYENAVFIYGNLLKDHVKALLYKDSAIWLVKHYELNYLQYKANYISGMYWISKDDPTNAAISFYQSLQNQPSKKDSAILLYTYNFLSTIYYSLKEYNLSAKNYLPVFNNINFNKLSENDIPPLINGYAYFSAADSTFFQYGKKCLLSAKSQIEENKNSYFYSILYYYLSDYYFRNKIPDSGFLFARKCIDNIQSSKDKTQKIEKPYLLLIEQHIKNRSYKEALLELNNLYINVDVNKIHIDDQFRLNQLAIHIYKETGMNSEYQKSLEQYISINEIENKHNRIHNLYQKLSVLDASFDKQEIEKLNHLKKLQRIYIFMLITVIVGLIVTSTVSIIAIKKKKKLKIEELKQIQRLNEIEFEKKLYNDRVRIAQELHDDLGTTITSIIIATEMPKKYSSTDELLERVKKLADLIYIQLNEIIWNLDIKNDNVKNLVNHIITFANIFFNDAQVKLKYNIEIEEPSLKIDGIQRRIIYLSIKELFNNIVKHANATTVDLIILQEGNHLQIEIKDDGIGIKKLDYDYLTNIGGNGIENIQSHIKKANGNITWSENDNGNGCKIKISLHI